jgi:hypothetical protein
MVYQLSLANRPRIFAIIHILILLLIVILLLHLLRIFIHFTFPLITATVPFHIHITI